MIDHNEFINAMVAMSVKARPATQAERVELCNHEVYLSAGEDEDEVWQRYQEAGITVYDNWFSNKTPYLGRLMIVGWPDSRLKHFAWNTGSQIELTDEEYDYFSAM